MLARATFRAASAPSLVARRGFQSTRAQLASPYHYPEGPRSNLPFDPLKKGFAFKYWGFMATGFSLPFLLADEEEQAVDATEQSTGIGLGHGGDVELVE
ncbi:Nn.00g062900.m01.CDS01 [Neocucurbitaria sp. VM-36]